MLLNDVGADRQAQPGPTVALGGERLPKNLTPVFRGNADPTIGNYNPNSSLRFIRPVAGTVGTHDQFSLIAQCFDCVQDKIGKDLSQVFSMPLYHTSAFMPGFDQNLLRCDLVTAKAKYAVQDRGQRHGRWTRDNALASQGLADEVTHALQFLVHQLNKLASLSVQAGVALEKIHEVHQGIGWTFQLMEGGGKFPAVRGGPLSFRSATRGAINRASQRIATSSQIVTLCMTKAYDDAPPKKEVRRQNARRKYARQAKPQVVSQAINLREPLTHRPTPGANPVKGGAVLDGVSVRSQVGKWQKVIES